MLKKVLTRAGIGFLIGALVGNIIAFLTGTSSTGGISFASQQLLDMSGGSAVLAMVLQSLFSGIYGALCFAVACALRQRRSSLMVLPFFCSSN